MLQEDDTNIKASATATSLASRSLLFNIAAFILNALYGTLSKIWVANIDASLVATTDAYAYIGVVTEVLNEDLPWNTIGEKANRGLVELHGLSYTRIVVQTALGLVISIAFVGAARKFAASFVPKRIRDASLTCIQIAAFSAFSSAMETAVAAATIALDQPDVPLVISSVKLAANIVLDFIFVSTFHVKSINPTISTLAATQLACNMVASISGLIDFTITTIKKRRLLPCVRDTGSASISFTALKTLARPGSFTFTESAIRNALYLWLVSGIVAMGSDYATAWGVFNTIRWGLVMVSVQALEATTLTFTGHHWEAWRGRA